jgi:2-polyprenyl-3-methyl-5-hydroxy-6-metoxy-1,4-benzoquinol methylase
MAKTSDVALAPMVEAEGSGTIQRIVSRCRTASRRKRSALFHSLFRVNADTRVLDLGGASGTHVHGLLHGTAAQGQNVHVADIDHDAVRCAATRFGYSPVFLAEDGALPFPDRYFDIVICSSVLEHVTLPKLDIWRETSGSSFARRARARQRQFAAELARVGVGYFVQVPSRWFPIETHTWLPLLAYLPRSLQCRIMEISNRFWIKRSIPDFYLPTATEMAGYFPGAMLKRERVVGVTKSLIAVKRIEA